MKSPNTKFGKYGHCVDLGDMREMISSDIVNDRVYIRYDTIKDGDQISHCVESDEKPNISELEIMRITARHILQNTPVKRPVKKPVK